MNAGSLLLNLGLLLVPQAGDPPVTATCRLTPEHAEIGQPLFLSCELVHPSEARLRVDELQDLGELWLLLEERRVRTRPIEGRPGFSMTEARWSLCALDVGEHELLAGSADYEWEGIPRRVEACSVSVLVNGALAEGEDAPRPTIGFREPPPETEPPTQIFYLLLAFFAVGAAGLTWGLTRRRRRPPPPAPPGPRERLAALRADDEEGLPELYYTLSGAVREAIDRRCGQNLAACTDEEWVERISASEVLSTEELDRATELLRGCERVKYGAELPTRWAAAEAIDEALGIVAGLEEEGGES